MDETIRRKIIELLDHHRLMTVATNRPDGWPQATTVGYVNDGLTIYFLCGPESQKAQNLARDNRLSLTIDHDVPDPMVITGLSMAAHAYPVSDAAEFGKAMKLLGERYPEYAKFPMPNPEEIRVYEGDLVARLLKGLRAYRPRGHLIGWNRAPRHRLILTSGQISRARCRTDPPSPLNRDRATDEDPRSPEHERRDRGYPSGPDRRCSRVRRPRTFE